MKIKILFVFFVAALLGCKNSTCPVCVLHVNALHLQDGAVAGWVEKADDYKMFDTTILMHMIDGGAVVYIEGGLVEGIYQVMGFDTTLTCIAYADDFGAPVNARNMLAKIKSLMPMPLRVPGFDSTIAVGAENLGGCHVSSWFDRFYIELSFNGYSDLQPALQDAAAFLTVYQKKINGE